MFGNRLLPLLFFCCACATFTAAQQTAIPVDSYQVIHEYPHDPDAYTQGLVYVDGNLYEGTGRNGKSSIRMVELTTGHVLQRFDVPAEYFGEGITDWASDLIELTWKAEKAFVYDRFSFSLRRTFTYKGEGWGITHDNKQLIMSDGSASLRFLDPQSFAETRRISVKDERGQPVLKLNELEYIHGEIYANVWETDRIVRISPASGKALGWIDLSGIIDKSKLTDNDAVLNGIAYDAKGDRLFVTGKLWPKLFEIKVVHRTNAENNSKSKAVPR